MSEMRAIFRSNWEELCVLVLFINSFFLTSWKDGNCLSLDCSAQCFWNLQLYKHSTRMVGHFHGPMALANARVIHIWRTHFLGGLEKFVEKMVMQRPEIFIYRGFSPYANFSLLRFFKKFHKFALCEFMSYALGYFISLVRFFWLFLPNLANANFG